MRDLNVITVSGMINQDPVYKEHKEDPRKTLLYYNIIVYTGRSFYVEKELVHERFFLNCTSYGEAAIELADKLKKGTYVQVSGMLKPNNYKKDDGSQVYSFRIMADVCIPMGNYTSIQEYQDHKINDNQSRHDQNINDSNTEHYTKDQNITETNTSMPPKRRTTMPMAQESDQQQSMKDSSQDSSQQVQQNQKRNAENQTSTPRDNSARSGYSDNRSNINLNQNQKEFENLEPEENPFNMAAVADEDDFENPYGDGNLPNPNNNY